MKNKIKELEEEIKALKIKAEKWDMLEDKIDKIYASGEDSEINESGEDNIDFTIIGEITLMAYNRL